MLEDLLTAGVLSPLDVHFAALMERLCGGSQPDLAVAAAMVSAGTRQGHVCVDLRKLGDGLPDGRTSAEVLPRLSWWVHILEGSPVVGRPGDFKPLILDEAGKLYLYRYWEYQEKLASALRARIPEAKPDLGAAADRLRESLDRLFPPSGEAADWQKIAAFAAVSRPFCVISGGPGTGKTTTVAKVLALLVEQAFLSEEGLAGGGIALAAPTGKAAARLQEAIQSAKARIDCPDPILQAIPETASTIHRLLGSIQGSPYFRHNEANPLPLDALVVDEASMVDLALMSKLLQALPARARLILLGDQDQLSSVEAGAVLGDICETGKKHWFSREFSQYCTTYCGCSLEDTLIAHAPSDQPKDCIIQLRKSYRFSGDSAIARLSRAVRESDADEALTVLKSGAADDIRWNDFRSGKDLAKAIKGEILQGFGTYLQAARALGGVGGEEPLKGLRQVFDLFETFRVLCGLREGPCGSSNLNTVIEAILADAHLLSRGKRWYVGRPVLIRQNDYSLRLFNGDIGIFLPDTATGPDHRVFFPGPEGRFRAFHPLRLPEHETVYSMTIHKSQGSEFDNVLLILPDRDAPLLTRELVYTGITRARRKVSLWGPESVLRAAISRSTERLSGLSQALWGQSWEAGQSTSGVP